MNIIVKTYNDLSKEELYDILHLRSEIFVVEQNCVYQDIDYKDQEAHHVLGFINQELVAYTRIFKAGQYFANASIGRVITKESYRKKGLGTSLIKKSITYVSQQLNENCIEISAQNYLLKFYSLFGFVTYGDSYLEDGISHTRMKRVQ